MYLRLNNIKDIPKFCKELNKFQAHFDIYNGRSVVDGKSLIGLYTLDFSREISIKIIAKDEEINEILKVLKKFS